MEIHGRGVWEKGVQNGRGKCKERSGAGGGSKATVGRSKTGGVADENTADTRKHDAFSFEPILTTCQDDE